MSAEPEVKQRKPCVECPFRRGTEHNGGSPPEVYVGQAMGPFLLACHMSANYWDNPRDPGHLQCAGAATFRANIERSEMLPAALLRLPKDAEAVFATPAELVAHHRGIPLLLAEMNMELLPPEKLMQLEMSKVSVQLVPINKVTDGK